MIRAALLSGSRKEALLCTYPGFVLWNLFSTYWLRMATVAGGVAAILANALIMVLPLLLIRSFFRSGLHPVAAALFSAAARSEEHTSELQSRGHLVCRLPLDKI